MLHLVKSSLMVSCKIMQCKYIDYNIWYLMSFHLAPIGLIIAWRHKTGSFGHLKVGMHAVRQ